MGKVQVKVKITNAIDEGLARRGQLEVSKVRSCEVEALVDTGAVSCNSNCSLWMSPSFSNFSSFSEMMKWTSS